MHKFHLGPSRVLSRDAWALRGCRGIRRDSKLPERDGQYEYRIRNLAEAHERMACESELKAMSEIEAQPGGKGSEHKAK